MKIVLSYLWKPAFIIIPFILGLLGFTMAGDSPLQAVYQCICLYGMGQKDVPPNVLVEIARWLAPLATAGGIVLLMKELRRSVHAWFARLTGKSVAVFGPKGEKELLLKALGMRGIDMDKRPVKAKRYILLGNDEENFDYYRTHLKKTQKDVFIKCSSLPAQASDHDKLHLFSPEEIAARLFWKEYCPYELSVRNGHCLQIVLIGFGKLGKELLLTALQNNIFDAKQHIEYHVIGSENGFRQIYHQLDQIDDPVHFYSGSWFDYMQTIRQAHMVIVAEQEGQLSLMRDLMLSLPEKKIHVLSGRSDGMAMLSDQGDLGCFDWKNKAMNPDYILCERLNEYAKRVNLRYAHLYDGVAETEENMQVQWQKLNTFTRYSNISAADYHSVQLCMLGDHPLTDEKLEWLAELEHIRWCRYHYLNNWTCGTPENGKNKDSSKRIHQSLIPYAQLLQTEKEKDRENIRLLLKLDRDISNSIL